MSHNIVPTAASIAAESGGGTTNFLRADGTWAAPGGGGGGITELTGDVTASGSGSVAATIANSVVTTTKMGGDVTTAGKSLLTAADASAQRTALALGTLATQSGTFSGTSSGTNTGDQTITLTGDVTGSGTGSFAATVANDSVTYAKMQNVSAASVLLGRGDGGAGDVQEITLGTNLSMTGTTLDATGGGSDPWTYVRLTSDFTISTTANNIVTGLAFTPAASVNYEIEGWFLLQTATTTTGARPGIAWPTGYTDGAAWTTAPSSATAFISALQNPVTGTANAASTGLPVVNRSYLGTMRALLIMGGSPGSTFRITLASETAAVNVTMKAGSFIKYRTYT